MCRIEAEYAMKLRLHILPVFVDDYEPDGW
jgi:hypothetical protein